MKDIGLLHYFLSIKVFQKKKKVWIGQESYANDVLVRFGMKNCKAVATPMNPGTKIKAADDSDEILNQDLYQSVVGSLPYLGAATWPDIAYAVSCAARYTSKPTKAH